MAISPLLRGNPSFLALLFSTGDGYFYSFPGESSFLASSHFPRRWLFLFLSGGFLLSLLFSFPPEIPISPLFRGNPSFLAFLISTGDDHFSSPPGDSYFPCSSPFHRRYLFHRFSGGITPFLLFSFPPEMAISLPFRVNLASYPQFIKTTKQPVPHKPAFLCAQRA